MELFRFADERIDESSGLVAGPAAGPGGERLFFTHNDSGDIARFFAVDMRGCTVAVGRLPGADAVDWEDAARARDRVWFGDIGDNRRRRQGIDVYAVAESDLPQPAPAGETAGASEACPPSEDRTVAFTRYRLRYPDAAHDAETLLVDPADGRLYVVTKEPTGRSGVYAGPARLDPDAVNPLERVAEFLVPPTAPRPGWPPELNGTSLAFSLVGPLLTTGGDIAPDRSRLVIRTYTHAWEWDLGPGAGIAVTLNQPPDRRIALPVTRQGEAITYAGRDLVTSCEDVGCPVHRIPAR